MMEVQEEEQDDAPWWVLGRELARKVLTLVEGEQQRRKKNCA